MTVEFGLALENFTPERKVPDIDAISAYSVLAEDLGFASVWAWDHLFLGARRPFPFLEALTTLSMVAARTSRIMLGTGILVLPIREPAILAKTAATIQLGSGGRLMLGVAAGWYERRVPRHRGAVRPARPDLRAQPGPAVPAVGRRRRDRRVGRPGAHPRADAAAAGAAAAGAHRRVRGPGAAPRGHPLRRLGDVLLHPGVHRRGVVQDPRLRRAGRPRPGPAQPGRPGPAVRRRLVRGGGPPGPRVRRRVLRRAGLERGDAGVGGPRHPRAVRRADRPAYIDAGVKHLVFCPYNYETEQLHRLAAEVLPLVTGIRAGAD